MTSSILMGVALVVVIITMIVIITAVADKLKPKVVVAYLTVAGALAILICMWIFGLETINDSLTNKVFVRSIGTLFCLLSWVSASLFLAASIFITDSGKK